MVRRHFRQFCVYGCVRACVLRRRVTHRRRSKPQWQELPVSTSYRNDQTTSQLEEDVTWFFSETELCHISITKWGRTWRTSSFLVAELGMDFIQIPPRRFPYLTTAVFLLAYSNEGSLCELCGSRGLEDGKKQVPPKRWWISTRMQGVASQKTVVWRSLCLPLAINTEQQSSRHAANEFPTWPQVLQSVWQTGEYRLPAGLAIFWDYISTFYPSSNFTYSLQQL